MAFHEQDFLMRQIQYLTQVLQQVLFKKNQNQHQKAVEEIQNALRKLTRDKPKDFIEFTPEETLNVFISDEKFHSELALAVADLLVEEGEMLREKSYSSSQKCYVQALLLYKMSLWDEKAAVPLDIHEIIKQIEQKLHPDMIDEINRIIE